MLTWVRRALHALLLTCVLGCATSEPGPMPMGAATDGGRLAPLPRPDLRSHGAGVPSAPGGTLEMKQLALGFIHSCGLTQSGRAVCWGSEFDGQDEFTAAGPYVELTAGTYFSCGLKQDGTVICRGSDDEDDQLNVPEGERFAAIVAGAYHVCGRREDGTVLCWGAATHEGRGVLDVPPEIDLDRLDASGLITCGIRSNDRLLCWGNDSWRLLEPVDEAVVDVAVGSVHVCALRPDGEAFCWGHEGPKLDPPEGERFVALTAGDDHSCGLREDGSVLCWGGQETSDEFGEWGQGLAPADDTFARLYTGDYHNCGLRPDGTARCWGRDFSGESNAP